ncbi:MAG: hypothetical protein K8J31_13665 [Anaerolineae bacterium]|nr:hypothetical protein [Anaerolineae bacterium]
MATQAAYQEHWNVLNGLVHSWDRRYRWQQTMLWLPRSLLPGAVAGIILFLMARFVPLLLPVQLALVTVALVLVGPLVMMATVWLRGAAPLAVARRFDRQFGLDERISTALELIGGRIHSTDELVHYQIDDARQRGQAVDARRALPLTTDTRAWTAVFIALVVLVILFLLPNPQAPVDTQAAAQQAAIEAAADDVQRITEQVASDTALSDEERQQLLEQLDRTEEILDEEAITPQEAFAALSDSQSELQERSESLNQQAQQQQSALQQASEALQDAVPNAGDQQQNQDTVPTLEEMKQSAEGMTDAQRQQAADALEQAANQLEQTNPEAAQALRDAAEALRNGDTQAAQEAMQRAAESIQQQQQQMQQQQQSAQNMQQSAQQLQQAAGQVAQQGQQQQQSGQQPSQQQGQQGQQSSQQDDSGVQPLQQQQSQQPGQQAGQQQGQQQAQQGGQQQAQTNQPGQQEGQPGSQPGQQPGQQSSDQNTAESQQPGVGAGAGDIQGSAGEENTAGSPGGEAAQDNNPDGAGEGQFDAVFAPRRIGGQGGPEIQLEPDTSDVPVTEGEFAQNPSGQSLVPYNQVYSDYSNAANRSLESDYIPLALRDVVREYFSSLEPGQK